VSNRSPILLLIHCIEPSSILQLGLHYTLSSPPSKFYFSKENNHLILPGFGRESILVYSTSLIINPIKIIQTSRIEQLTRRGDGKHKGTELTVMYTIAPPNGDNAKRIESQLMDKGTETNGDER